jgi:hypothetical protein
VAHNFGKILKLFFAWEYIRIFGEKNLNKRERDKTPIMIKTGTLHSNL